jgi:photosystem II stability/assembly factor-like uncharacterized protein
MGRGYRARAAGPALVFIPTLCAALGLALVVGIARGSAGEKPDANSATSRTWENYFGVAILPSDRAVVVGDKGLIMTSDDQGHTWQRRQVKKGFKYFDLYGVAFAPDGAHGWAVGDGGAIFRSDDRGATWNPQESKQTAALLKVAAVDAQHGCVTGEHGVVLCTTDGGTTWNAQKFEDMVFFDLAFTDPNNGWAVGEFATTLRTTDGGKTWAIQTGGQRNLTSDPSFAIAFENASNGLILGLNGEDMTTNDGGKTWKAGALAGQHRSFYAAAGMPAGASSGIYIGGQDGVTARVAGGEVQEAPSATANSITALALSPHLGLAVGMGGTIIRSTDSGQHWSAWNAGDSAQTRAN